MTVSPRPLSPLDPPLLSDVWKEIGRHVDIEEATAQVARRAAAVVPLEALVIRRIQMDRPRVETVAETWLEEAPARRRPGEAQSILDGDALESLLAWQRAGTLVRRLPAPGDALREVISPTWWTGDVLAALLTREGQPGGVLILLGARGAFTEAHAAAAAQLVEPMEVALANDARVAELSRLREALEADKRALLWRLGRQDVMDAVVGATTGLREVMARVEQVARTDVPVLLLGETGSGKEVVARQIHARSGRSSGPIERINCGAIPPGLVDSELFGHERGSFTGAVSARKGWFERAEGGTLFLDEVGELPLDAQVRLLRVLQDGTFERVGAESTRHADVRVIAATNRELREMVEERTFRQDLWFRLSVFPIVIPPLREHPEDIPALAAHFGWRAGRRLGRGPLSPSARDLDLLVAYPWPGNVRELAAVIERAAILGNGLSLEIESALGQPAPAAAVSGAPRALPAPIAARAAPPSSFPTLDAAMARHIEQALVLTRGRVEGERGAARLLGINPHTLRARMRRLGVDWAHFRTER
ncbi:MAG TPA: sigma 54-interacting transcriptional regulator [Longimicrobiales bacterium]|nr:sigma 54-interacting transcriptional regulator [Longimicrobiales bacterium]